MSRVSVFIYDERLRSEAGRARRDPNNIEKFEVKIGPSAFDGSPGWLKSTVIHEVEVHVNMQGPRGGNTCGNQGLHMREHEAYRYELRKASLTGIAHRERGAILNQLDAIEVFLASENRKRVMVGDHSSCERKD